MKHKKILVLLIVFFLLLTTGGHSGSANIASNLVIHDVDVSISDIGDVHNIELLISALDSSNRPITDLNQLDVNLTENGQPVEVDSIEPIKDLPINIILMIDNSYHMRGARIRSAKNATIDFINTLHQGDSISIYTFNPNIIERVPLTNDLQKAREDFQSTDLLTGFGACLFDAVYHAIQVANTYSPERQAIIVLSGGPDERAGGDKCSTKTVNQILNLANLEGNLTPVYTIGIGDNLETTSLERLSEETRGMYFHSSQDAGITNAMKQISNRLDSQYLVRFTSTAGPGKQSVAVQVEQFTNSIEIILPDLPPEVTIVFPEAAELIDAVMTTFVLDVVERGIPVDSIEFRINDVPIGVGGPLGQPPFEFKVDLSQHAGREITLSILALDKDGVELAQADRLIDVIPDPVTALEPDLTPETDQEDAITPTDDTQMDDESVCPPGRICWGRLQLTGLHLALSGLAAVFLFTLPPFLLIKRRKQQNQMDSSGFDKTIDGFALPFLPFGRLTVLASDNPELIGKDFELNQLPTTIGRSIDNDIVLPEDSAVSRNHLEILPIGDDVIAREMIKAMKDGTKKGPTYGTYINDHKITDEVTLTTGDEVRLGPRTKFLFEAVHPPQPENDSDELTIDEMSLPSNQDDEATRDG